jgi:AcrR family transcriptional regulator
MTDTESGLPAAIEQLWGLRGSSRRGGPRPALSLERIVAAAVELADEGGLAALSMSRLAEKLGFTTMSLYRYVASKDDLLVLLLDAAIGLPPDAADAPAAVDAPDAADAPPAVDGAAAVGRAAAVGGADWRVGAQAWARALRAGYGRHPWMVELPISGLPAGPNQLVWFERGLRVLGRTTLEPGERAAAVLLLATYVRAQTQLVQDLTRAGESGGVDWAAVVRRVADPQRFPEVAAVVAAGVFEDEPDDFPDDDFGFGLERILAGIEVLHRSRVGA